MERVNIWWMRSFISSRSVAGGQYRRKSFLISLHRAPAALRLVPPTLGLRDTAQVLGLRFLMVI